MGNILKEDSVVDGGAAMNDDLYNNVDAAIEILNPFGVGSVDGNQSPIGSVNDIQMTVTNGGNSNDEEEDEHDMYTKGGAMTKKQPMEDDEYDDDNELYQI